jgi:hypothetical protein
VFDDPNKKRVTQVKLHALKKNIKQSADEYFAEFDQLATLAGFNDKALLEEKGKRGSLIWTMEMLRSDDDKALKILHCWTNRQRTSEVDLDLLQLHQFSPIQQREVLHELKCPRSWIHKIHQNSVVTSVIICTLDDQHTFELNALLDCGATGCYIDEGFAHAKGLNLDPLPRLIPVYNADGLQNEGGPI